MRNRSSRAAASISVEKIERTIVRIRNHRVMLDADLAVLYRVTAKGLNQAVKRNRERFPEDFMFRLTGEELRSLRSQSVTLKRRRGRHRKYLPYAFTEQGVAMPSGVLRSRRAVKVNVEIMRAFVRLRHMLRSNAELARELDQLEAKYDGQFEAVFQAIRQLMAPPAAARKRIGFLQVRHI
jgi:aromatic ring-opening dioxygenase LigB subunit